MLFHLPLFQRIECCSIRYSPDNILFNSERRMVLTRTPIAFFLLMLKIGAETASSGNPSCTAVFSTRAIASFPFIKKDSRDKSFPISELSVDATTLPSTNFLWKPGSHKTVTGKIMGASSGHLQKLTDLSSIRLRNDCYITECGIFFMSFNPVVAQKECCRHRECCNDNCR